MGIFEEEQKKMAEEASARVRADEQRKAELGQMARRVSDDALSFIANNPGDEDVDVSLLENQITLRGRSSHRTLEISCDGSDMFRLKGDIETSTAITRSSMARRVISWIREPRTGA